MKREKSLVLLLCATMAFGLCACRSTATGSGSTVMVNQKEDTGLSLLKAGKYEEAILSFTKEINIDSKNINAYAGRMAAYSGYLVNGEYYTGKNPVKKDDVEIKYPTSEEDVKTFFKTDYNSLRDIWNETADEDKEKTANTIADAITEAMNAVMGDPEESSDDYSTVKVWKTKDGNQVAMVMVDGMLPSVDIYDKDEVPSTEINSALYLLNAYDWKQTGGQYCGNQNALYHCIGKVIDVYTQWDNEDYFMDRWSAEIKDGTLKSVPGYAHYYPDTVCIGALITDGATGETHQNCEGHGEGWQGAEEIYTLSFDKDESGKLRMTQTPDYELISPGVSGMGEGIYFDDVMYFEAEEKSEKALFDTSQLYETNENDDQTE